MKRKVKALLEGFDETEILRLVIAGLEAKKGRIETEMALLRARIGQSVSTPKRGKGYISEAGKRRIAIAQRKRWAAIRRGERAMTAGGGA